MSSEQTKVIKLHDVFKLLSKIAAAAHSARGHEALICWEGSGVFWSHHIKYSADLLSFHTVELGVYF